MQWFARVSTRKNIIAIVIGALLAGAPLVAFNWWLGGLIDRQGQDEVDTSARRAIALAESRINQVIGALDGLAARGVDSCSPADIMALRRGVFETMPIKEIDIVGPQGETLCTDLGLPLGQRKVADSEPLSGARWYTLDIVQLESGQSMVRLRRKLSTGPNEIAALVPALLFLPQVSMNGNPFSAYAHVVTAKGMLIGVLGQSPDTRDAVFSATSSSAKFGLSAEVAMPRGQMITANHAELRWLGMFVAGAVVMILGVIAVLIPPRMPGNPVTEIENALRAGEFVPYYQPIVDIRSGQLRGAEVLVRWRKPDGTLVLPGFFIPIAESSGLIRDMTRDLMRRVCAEMGDTIGARPSLKVSFNLAGQLFSDEKIVNDIRKIFANTPIKFQQVVLEVTERDPIENFTATRQTIAAFQGLGMRIAIDDVGTGHSGLSYMLKLGVDIIKIDKMFIDAIGTDRNSTTIVETLVDLAHNMRMDIVAEGVENFEQVVFLRELGVPSAQGYVFSPPLPGKAFLQLVEAIDPLPAAVQQPKLAMPRASAA